MHSTEYTWIDDFYEDIPETVFCDFYRVQLGVGSKGMLHPRKDGLYN